MAEYKCFCKKPRRQSNFCVETIDDAIDLAAKKWGIPREQVNASRINIPAELELQKQIREDGGRVVRKRL